MTTPARTDRAVTPALPSCHLSPHEVIDMTRGVGGKSPANIQTYLEGVSYPADKATLVGRARENGAPKEVMDVIEQLDDQEYGGPQEVMKSYGNIE
jgi:hypothetical protein